MTHIFIYIIQVCGWFLPLYFLYLFLFKNYTFFNWNRWYLLLIGVASFGFPFIHYTIIETKTIYTALSPKHLQSRFLETENNSINDIISNTVDKQPEAWNWLQILAVVYTIGMIVTGAKLLYGLFNIKRVIEKAKQGWNNNIAMVFTTDKVPHSSFFNYIFINKKAKSDQDLDKIIYHEMQHNEKLHSVDVLFCEILKILMWFNPYVYSYKKSLQEIHEFEVDAEMTKLYNKENYAQLLLRVASLNINKLISTFSSTPLKTRILMMFNPKTYPMKKLAFLLVLPVVAFLLMAYGNVKHKTITAIRTVNTKEALTIVIDAGHGGIDKGAASETYQESLLNLATAMQLEQVAKDAGYTVIMTRNTDTAVSLVNRIKIANSTNAVAFISVHYNAAISTAKNGVEVYISSKNGALKESSKKLADNILSGLKQIPNISISDSLSTRDAKIYLTENADMPTVLLELGYLSNVKDLAFVSQAKYQKQMAEKIIKGINNFVSNK